jgi:DNA polymerase-3 subunit delta
MSDPAPVVYILHGEDEFAMAEFVAQMQAKLGDASMVDMNTTRLDGKSAGLDQVVNAAAAMPFLAKRRLVIVANPLALVKSRSEVARQKLLDALEKLPETTALVLLEPRPLTDERERRAGKQHWLEKWAEAAGERVFLKAFSLPRGPAMSEWIIQRARHFGGQFSRSGADKLAEQIGDDPRLADQEIQKLLAYANYAHPVEADDVEHLTPSVRQGDIFAMVDALGNRQGRQAQEMLHRLLAEQEAISIFGMVVRQFRLLLLAREVLDSGGREAEVARAAGVHPFVAGKVAAQARFFTPAALERIYHRLLELDEAIKTSQMDDVLALDMFVAALAL